MPKLSPEREDKSRISRLPRRVLLTAVRFLIVLVARPSFNVSCIERVISRLENVYVQFFDGPGLKRKLSLRLLRCGLIFRQPSTD